MSDSELVVGEQNEERFWLEFGMLEFAKGYDFSDDLDSDLESEPTEGQ